MWPVLHIIHINTSRTRTEKCHFTVLSFLICFSHSLLSLFTTAVDFLLLLSSELPTGLIKWGKPCNLAGDFFAAGGGGVREHLSVEGE